MRGAYRMQLKGGARVDRFFFLFAFLEFEKYVADFILFFAGFSVYFCVVYDSFEMKFVLEILCL